MSIFFEDDDELDIERIDTYEDDDDVLISDYVSNRDSYDKEDYMWANFNYKVLWGKTDRWDKQNYYPTDWEIFLRDK